jgi:hypothetical protein
MMGSPYDPAGTGVGWQRTAKAAGLDPLSIEGVALNYASDKGWPAAVNRIQKEILTFMPEEVSVKQEITHDGTFNEPVVWDEPITKLTYAWIRHKERKGGTHELGTSHDSTRRFDCRNHHHLHSDGNQAVL